jgi:hypothetical protein
VADYERGGDGDSGDFQRIGGGSLGGKARGLAFMRLLLAESRAAREFTAVRVAVPPAVVLGTDVFDRFLDQNGLRDFALQADDDAEVLARFRAAALPEDIRDDLAAFLERMGEPLAVRSSSLLEDSQYHPFTGVYDTYMLPNDHPFLPVRLEQLVDAVKRLYAGTFSRRAKAYMRATPYRLEEEKMAVILQRIAGAAHGRRFYPDFAGVARSHNFYPTGPMKAADGIAAVAFGLGRTVVDGERCLRFSPRYPRHLVEFSTVAEMVRNSQRSFWALDLAAPADTRDPMLREARFDLQAAEADGTLAAVASTFSPENQSVSDGVSRAGVRLVSFAPVLKHGLFPLPEVLQELLALGEWGLGGPVEVEFAVTLSVPRGAPCEFAFLQLRPLAMSREPEELQVGAVAGERLLCRSRNVLGHGRLDGIRDVVVVDRDRFERAQSAQVARELAVFNGELTAREEPYVLVGVGRWGSADPWLGIPVTWDQISGARVIVEAGFRDADVAPSQGTHFFQNLTSFNVGYFTVGRAAGDGAVDWDWLAAQPAVRETGCVRHLRLASPLVVAIDGKTGEGVILKPE